MKTKMLVMSVLAVLAALAVGLSVARPAESPAGKSEAIVPEAAALAALAKEGQGPAALERANLLAAKYGKPRLEIYKRVLEKSREGLSLTGAFSQVERELKEGIPATPAVADPYTVKKSKESLDDLAKRVTELEFKVRVLNEEIMRLQERR